MIKAKFELVRETRGTWVYNEIDDRGQKLDLPQSQVGVIYVRKTAMPIAATIIEITIINEAPSV